MKTFMPMLNVEGCSLFYSVKGEGTPIIFIHPPVLTSVNFTYQLSELSKHFQVITFDIRGHGNSEQSRIPITYSIIVEDMKTLLNHLDVKKAFICGYSTGASIALEFLLTSGERALGGILISGMSEVSDKNLKKRISLGVKLAKTGAVHVLAWSIAWSNSNNQTLLKMLGSAAQKGDARNIEQYYKYSLHYNCTNQLGNINVPTILVYGQKDTKFKSYANILHEKLPSNELIFIENSDHRIPTKEANELNQLISQFMKDNTFSD